MTGTVMKSSEVGGERSRCKAASEGTPEPGLHSDTEGLLHARCTEGTEKPSREWTAL